MSVLINGTNGLIQAYDYQVLATGFSYTFAAGTQTLVINPAGTLATGTITMPASPSDGMTITISTTKQITSLTLNGNTGQSILGAVTSMAPYQVVAFVYRAANTSWFPTMTQVAQAAGPAFSAYVGSTQSATGGAYTKMALNTEQIDTNNCFDSTTNYRFTPTVAGYYVFAASAQPNTTGNIVQVNVYKNGAIYKGGAYTGAGGSYQIGQISGVLVYLNGSTDYVEFYCYSSGTGDLLNNSTNNWASGYMVRSA